MDWTSSGQTIIVMNGERYPTAFVPAWTDDDSTAEEAEANARLIAAAPELLASLKEALRCLEGNQHTPNGTARYERALAAISKATTP